MFNKYITRTDHLRIYARFTRIDRMRPSLSNQSSLCVDKDMSYSIKLPYLGGILLGKSPLNLTSFQKPLRELYISYYQKNSHNQRRIIISDYDVLIFEPDAVGRGKRTFIYTNFESIVDIQILKLSLIINNTQAAFLPIGCEDQERFRSLYSSINQLQYHLLSSSKISHPSLLLFVIRKPGVGNSCSLLDCHVFAVHRQLIAFELCNMIRKLIIKRTMSPILFKKNTFICKQDQTNNHLLENVDFNDVVHTPSLSLVNNVQHRPPPSFSYDTSEVLTMNSDIHSMSSKQRHFIKASTLIQDESDEIVNDLMNIVANEKLKTQGSIKRHGSFEQISYSDDHTMNKKRYFHHNKKRLSNPLPAMSNNMSHQQEKIHSRIDGHLLRPDILVNRYGDIGNYVPKFLRENITIRSSDSNENIFFRSTNGQLLNGFLKLDILPLTENHYQKEQIRKNFSNHIDDDHRVPHVLKSIEDVLNGIKIHPFIQQSSSSKLKRITETELPVDYRQYLRHTDQAVYLYGEEQRQQTTLEHSLGYLP